MTNLHGRLDDRRMDIKKCVEGQQFPLFAHLKNELPPNTEGLTPSQRAALVENMKELNDQGCSLVYALIRYYQIYEMGQDAVEMPFGMKKIKTGHRFCIEELPPLLQNLICRFVDIHLRSQKEQLI